uniref:Uncharacterized protein n=1 Tax=Arundo donax TaxID=35708 RepID=A0A0A9GPK9_ARUDO
MVPEQDGAGRRRRRLQERQGGALLRSGEPEGPRVAQGRG